MSSSKTMLTNEDKRIAVQWALDQPLHRGAHRTISETNDALLRGLRSYFMIGRPSGDFIMAILRNDFCEAVGRADPQTRQILKAFSIYLSNYPTRKMWGDEQTVTDWIEYDGLLGHLGPDHARESFHELKL